MKEKTYEFKELIELLEKINTPQYNTVVISKAILTLAYEIVEIKDRIYLEDISKDDSH